MSFKRQVDGSHYDPEGGWLVMRERVFGQGRGLSKTWTMKWALYQTPTRSTSGKYQLLAHYRTLSEAKKAAGASVAPWLGSRAAPPRAPRPRPIPPRDRAPKALRAEDIVYGPRYLGSSHGFRLWDGSVLGSGDFVVTKSGWVYLGEPDTGDVVRMWSPEEWSREPGALEVMQAFARTEGPDALAFPQWGGRTGLAARLRSLNRPRIR